MFIWPVEQTALRISALSGLPPRSATIDLTMHAISRLCLSWRAGAFLVGAFLTTCPVSAETGSATDLEVRRLAQLVQAQSERIAAQEEALARQGAMIEKQGRALSALINPHFGEGSLRLDDLRARGAAEDTEGTPTAPRPLEFPDAPVGRPQQESDISPEFAALPESAGVLTPQGTLVLEPSLEYTRSSANRLVFRGVEIIAGVQIGVIEANDADRDTFVATGAARYGLTDRLEVEARVPFLRRSDRITTVQQRDDVATRSISLDGEGIGDVEAAARYQLNRGTGGGPIFIGNLRVKSDTGTGPFDIDRDEFGIARKLTTGSGFWSVEPGLTMLMPSDPAVIFAGVSYLWNIEKLVDRVSGDVLVGNVDPGDSIGATLGFGFALNERFSYSLGYKHNYLRPSTTELNGTDQRSDSLQVGAFLFGLSYRLGSRAALNANFEIGATSDAPDARIVFRIPWSFGG